MTEIGSDIYFDPFDRAIKADPYGLYRRLRNEAPLYYNDRHKFYAVSRFADVERGLTDNETFSSAKGCTVDMIQAGVAYPPGMFINEDPPQHTKHRQIVSILFTPRAVSSLEPKVRSSARRRSTRSWARGASTSCATSPRRYRCG